MNNIIVMYHYVRDDSKFNTLSTEKFFNQVKGLQSKFLILSLSELLEYEGRKKTCVLTFDDGLKDAVLNVLPILQELKIKATFFIPTQILEKSKVIHVQKRHFLLTQIGSNKLVRELNRRLPKELKITADPMCKADYIDGDLLTCSIKWMFDYLDADIIEPILDQVFDKFFPDEKTIFNNTYLSKSDLKKLIDAGMDVGIHGHSHKRLGMLYYQDQELEIEKSIRTYNTKLGIIPKYMSYPSGSYNPLTIRLLQKYKIEAAVNIEKKINKNKTSVYELGRYDCIDFPI